MKRLVIIPVAIMTLSMAFTSVAKAENLSDLSTNKMCALIGATTVYATDLVARKTFITALVDEVSSRPDFNAKTCGTNIRMGAAYAAVETVSEILED